jgi:hypothetical protein
MEVALAHKAGVIENINSNPPRIEAAFHPRAR